MVAPKGEPSASILRSLVDPSQPTNAEGGGVAANFLLAGAAAALATIATVRTVADVAGSGCTGKEKIGKPGIPVSYFCGACSSDDSDSDSDRESASESCGDDGEAGPSHVTPSSSNPASGKLWTKEQFPEGADGPANWDLSNLTAAQAWECPCLDRRNCIGSERIPLLHLYEHRKLFRTTAKGSGGFRDTARKDMEERYMTFPIAPLRAHSKSERLWTAVLPLLV